MNTTIISEGSQAKNKENHNKNDLQKFENNLPGRGTNVPE